MAQKYHHINSFGLNIDSITSFYSFSNEVQGLIWKLRYDEKKYAEGIQFTTALESFN